MYKPDTTILKKYADVLVKFALNSGKGINPEEVALVYVPDVAKPLLVELNKAILEAGAHPILRILPTNISRATYELSNESQLTFFPRRYHKALTDLIDHQIGIIADTNLQELENIDPKKIMLSLDARKTTREWLEDKEYAGKFTWTLALYPTLAMAEEAGLTLEEYWKQVIKACFLDQQDPIREWDKIFIEQKRVKAKLDKMNIQHLHIKGRQIDLKVKIGEKRKWLGGGGRNIPSFEIFISPDWRGTEGYIYFNQPLYMYGNKIHDVFLEFQKGKVIKAHAKRGNKILQDMISRRNADKLGEFSLTDKRASRITKFMANTLYDENIGGRYGNMHIALGLAYKESFAGDVTKLKKKDWKLLGFNQSPEHKDLVTTADKTVIATLPDNSRKIIYKSGEFVI